MLGKCGWFEAWAFVRANLKRGCLIRHSVRPIGKSKLESLKLARDEIRKQGFDHPFFWSAFILVGEVN
jgi:CHAT domain-containing protein